MAVISITYNGTDITNKVLFSSASFESQLNAQPGTCSLQVLDRNQTLSFTTGKEITLSVDGQKLWGGYLTQVGRTFAFPVVDTVTSGPDTVDSRIWELRGVDYNILFDKRVVRYAAAYTAVLPTYPAGTYAGAVIRELLCPRYLDLPSGFDYTTFVANVAVMNPSAVGAIVEKQGDSWRKAMEILAMHVGAIWYITPDLQLYFNNVEHSAARWGFSDVPNKRAIVTGGPLPTYGFRELDALEDGTSIVNDALIWGGNELTGGDPLTTTGGGIVFSRFQDADSIAAHGRWQYAQSLVGDPNFAMQDTVDMRARVLVTGAPTADVEASIGTDELGLVRGLRTPSDVIRLAWFDDDVPALAGVKQHLAAGNVVDFVFYALGADLAHPFARRLPLRNLRISFVTLPGTNPTNTTQATVRFDGTFGIQLNDPWYFWQYLMRTKYTTPATSLTTASNSSSTATYGAIGSFSVTPNPDGSTKDFYLYLANSSHPAYLPGSTIVYRNGLLQRPNIDYTETDPAGGRITFSVAPLSTDWVWVVCRLSGV
jgi:hypothetical protein